MMVWTKHNYQFDAQGNTRALLDSSTDTVTDTFTYDAWGNEVEHSGTSQENFTWNGRVGYYRDRDTNTYQVRRRPYVPKLGRWKAVDPIWPSGDLFAYCYAYNNPSGYIDPAGLVTIRCNCSCYNPRQKFRFFHEVETECGGLAESCCSTACKNTEPTLWSDYSVYQGTNPSNQAGVSGWGTPSTSVSSSTRNSSRCGWRAGGSWYSVTAGKDPFIDKYEYCKGEWKTFDYANCWACCVHKYEAGAVIAQVIGEWSEGHQLIAVPIASARRPKQAAFGLKKGFRLDFGTIDAGRYHKPVARTENVLVSLTKSGSRLQGSARLLSKSSTYLVIIEGLWDWGAIACCSTICS